MDYKPGLQPPPLPPQGRTMCGSTSGCCSSTAAAPRGEAPPLLTLPLLRCVSQLLIQHRHLGMGAAPSRCRLRKCSAAAAGPCPLKPPCLPFRCLAAPPSLRRLCTPRGARLPATCGTSLWYRPPGKALRCCRGGRLRAGCAVKVPGPFTTGVSQPALEPAVCFCVLCVAAGHDPAPPPPVAGLWRLCAAAPSSWLLRRRRPRRPPCLCRPGRLRRSWRLCCRASCVLRRPPLGCGGAACVWRGTAAGLRPAGGAAAAAGGLPRWCLPSWRLPGWVPWVWVLIGGRQ
jgi:hypothetical protein